MVCQKDLGKKTEVLAKAMKEYNRHSAWHKAEEQQELTAAEKKANCSVFGLLSSAQRTFLRSVPTCLETLERPAG